MPAAGCRPGAGGRGVGVAPSQKAGTYLSALSLGHAEFAGPFHPWSGVRAGRSVRWMLILAWREDSFHFSDLGTGQRFAEAAWERNRIDGPDGRATAMN